MGDRDDSSSSSEYEAALSDESRDTSPEKSGSEQDVTAMLAKANISSMADLAAALKAGSSRQDREGSADTRRRSMTTRDSRGKSKEARHSRYDEQRNISPRRSNRDSPPPSRGNKSASDHKETARHQAGPSRSERAQPSPPRKSSSSSRQAGAVERAKGGRSPDPKSHDSSTKKKEERNLSPTILKLARALITQDKSKSAPKKDSSTKSGAGTSKANAGTGAASKPPSSGQPATKTADKASSSSRTVKTDVTKPRAPTTSGGAAIRPGGSHSRQPDKRRSDFFKTKIGNNSIETNNVFEWAPREADHKAAQCIFRSLNRFVDTQNDHVVWDAVLPGVLTVVDSVTTEVELHRPLRIEKQAHFNRFLQNRPQEQFQLTWGDPIFLGRMEPNEAEGMLDPRVHTVVSTNKVIAGMNRIGTWHKDSMAAVAAKLLIRSEIHSFEGLFTIGYMLVIQLSDLEHHDLVRVEIRLPADTVHWHDVSTAAGCTALSDAIVAGELCLARDDFTTMEIACINHMCGGLPRYNMPAQAADYHCLQGITSPVVRVHWYRCGVNQAVNCPLNQNSHAMWGALHHLATNLGQVGMLAPAAARAHVLANVRVVTEYRLNAVRYNRAPYVPFQQFPAQHMPVRTGTTAHMVALDGTQQDSVFLTDWLGVIHRCAVTDANVYLQGMLLDYNVAMQAEHEAEQDRLEGLHNAGALYAVECLENAALERYGARLPRVIDFNALWRTIELSAHKLDFVQFDSDLRSLMSMTVRDYAVNGAAFAACVSIAVSSFLTWCNATGACLSGWLRNTRDYDLFCSYMTNMCLKKPGQIHPPQIFCQASTILSDFTDFVAPPRTLGCYAWSNNCANKPVNRAAGRWGWGETYPRIPFPVNPISVAWLIRAMPSLWGYTCAPVGWKIATDIVNYGHEPAWFSYKGEKMYLQQASSQFPFAHVAYGGMVLNALRQVFNTDAIRLSYTPFQRDMAGQGAPDRTIPDPTGNAPLTSDPVSRLLDPGQVLSYDWVTQQVLSPTALRGDVPAAAWSSIISSYMSNRELPAGLYFAQRYELPHQVLSLPFMVSGHGAGLSQDDDDDRAEN